MNTEIYRQLDPPTRQIQIMEIIQSDEEHLVITLEKLFLTNFLQFSILQFTSYCFENFTQFMSCITDYLKTQYREVCFTNTNIRFHAHTENYRRKCGAPFWCWEREIDCNGIGVAVTRRSLMGYSIPLLRYPLYINWELNIALLLLLLCAKRE